MNNLCFVKGRFYFPLSRLNEEQLDNFKSNLTYTSPYLVDGKVKTIRLYTLDDTHIGLPIEWVKSNYPNLFALAENKQTVVYGLEATRLPDPKHPRVKNPEAQERFMVALDAALDTHLNVLAYAPTGSGKTVVALRTAAVKRLKTIVFVHTTDLRDQWIAEIQDKLGIPRDQIGIIQQDKCEVEGKQIVVAMLQTQARREYDDSVYDSFGLAIVDECHRLSTEFFADVLPKFSTKYRIGLTATPNRKDGQDVILWSTLGPVRVIADTEVMPIKVYSKRYYSKRKLWGKDEQQRIMCLTRDPDRNELIVEFVKQLYNANRNILVVSHSVAHLEHLMRMAEEAGIPSYAMGQLTASKITYDKNHTWKAVGKRNMSTEERAEAKTKQVIFATENLIKEGVDIPRLDAGIECVPFWNATQRIGRIRRYMKGKLYPKWITIRDMKCQYAKDMYNARVKDYLECQATIINL